MTRLSHNLLSPLTHVGTDLDRIFAGVFDPDFDRRDAGSLRGDWLPALDILEEEDVYRIEAELPGFQLDDVDVTIEGRKLVITGKKSVTETSETEEGKTPTYLVRERQGGSFTRTVTLPVSVDPTKADAAMRNGVLTLSVPKAEAARQHKIDIRTR